MLSVCSLNLWTIVTVIKIIKSGHTFMWLLFNSGGQLVAQVAKVTNYKILA